MAAGRKQPAGQRFAVPLAERSARMGTIVMQLTCRPERRTRKHGPGYSRGLCLEHWWLYGPSGRRPKNSTRKGGRPRLRGQGPPFSGPQWGFDHPEGIEGDLGGVPGDPRGMGQLRFCKEVGVWWSAAGCQHRPSP